MDTNATRMVCAGIRPVAFSSMSPGLDASSRTGEAGAPEPRLDAEALTIECFQRRLSWPNTSDHSAPDAVRKCGIANGVK